MNKRVLVRALSGYYIALPIPLWCPRLAPPPGPSAGAPPSRGPSTGRMAFGRLRRPCRRNWRPPVEAAAKVLTVFLG